MYMRIFLTIFFCLLLNYADAQRKSSNYISLTCSVPWKTVRITLTMGDTEIYTTNSDSTTIMIYQDLEPGYYTLTLSNNENLTELRDSIFVQKGQKITANIRLETTCAYQYANNAIPLCPAGHKNGILEIRYRNEKNRAGATKYHLIHYTASGCIARFYCSKHDLEF